MLRTATRPEGAVTPLRTPDVVMNPGFVGSCLISNKAECNCHCAVLSLVTVRIFPLIWPQRSRLIISLSLPCCLTLPRRFILGEELSHGNLSHIRQV